jgi:hypothetical protein
MLLPLLLSTVLALQTGTPTGTPIGTIEGRISPSDNVKLTKPVQVAVFTGSYVELYFAEVQKRVDNYWEDYRGLFIQDKEAFLAFRDRAQRQAMEFTLNRMRQDDPRNITNFFRTTTNNVFEFHGVPVGECRVVAVVTIGNQEFVWSDTVILTDRTPALVVLKSTTP